MLEQIYCLGKILPRRHWAQLRGRDKIGRWTLFAKHQDERNLLIAARPRRLGQVCVGQAGDAKRLHQTGPQDQELLENLRQAAEHRRIDQNNVVLRSARRHFKTVKVVYTRQAVSEPTPRR